MKNASARPSIQRQFLLDLLKPRLSSEQWSWLEGSMAKASVDAAGNDILSSYTAASRHLGKRALQLDSSERSRLLAQDPLFTLDHWGADEAGRAAILLSTANPESGQYSRIALQCYELGDSREQQSWLRALFMLPGCERFVAAAIDSCRTNIIPLFESMACENPYPSRYFPELNFNQLVMKCLFNRIELRRIIGLDSRLNSELSRMAAQYASERQAAGRDVPEDIGMVLAPGERVT